MNRSAKTLLTVAAGTFLAWGGLNTSGYCFAEMRYVPDKEFFARYLESTRILLDPDIIQVRSLAGDRTVQSFKTFKTGIAYIDAYPDCCSYGPQAGVTPDSDSPPSLFQRLFGIAWGLVAIHYRLQYTNAGGQTKEYKSFYQSWVTSCGDDVRRY